MSCVPRISYETMLLHRLYRRRLWSSHCREYIGGEDWREGSGCNPRWAARHDSSDWEDGASA